jgi:hypothetical protein
MTRPRCNGKVGEPGQLAAPRSQRTSWLFTCRGCEVCHMGCVCAGKGRVETVYDHDDDCPYINEKLLTGTMRDCNCKGGKPCTTYQPKGERDG